MKKFILISILALLAIFTTQAQEPAKQVLTKPGINSKTAVTATSEKINYLNNVTGDLQTQLNGTVKTADLVTGATKTLYVKTTSVSNTGNTTENTVLTFTLPGNQLGPNGYLKIYAHISHTSNTNYKSANIYIGGTKVAMATSNGLTGAGSRHLWTIVNRNSVSSQAFANPGYIGTGFYSGNLGASSTLSTATINTGADMTCTVSLQCATSASDVISLDFLLVESVYMP